MPVTTAWSIHSFASARDSPGRIPIVVPPADFAPRAAAAITSPSPPQTTVAPALGEQPPDLLRARLVLDAAADHRDLGHGVRRRRVAAASASASSVTARTIARVARDQRGVAAVDRALQPVVGPGQRQHVRDPLEHGRHLVARDEQAAEQELRQHERRHELHRLELRLRERAREQAERHAEQRVADREQHDHDDRSLDVEAEQPERDAEVTVAWTAATSANASP